MLAKKVNTFVKYLDFANVFSKKISKMLLKQIGINEHTFN